MVSFAMNGLPAFALSGALARSNFLGAEKPRGTTCATRHYVQSYHTRITHLRADATPPTPDDVSRQEQAKSVERMRSRLEGLFGSEEEKNETQVSEQFNGIALRTAIRERWGVQYDVQPQKRHGRVYVQIMWRYFEQQSFYMEEDEFASHCEAVARMLQQWNAVDYFCDYIASIKKRPVVGITINIPIPGIQANAFNFE